LSAFSAYNAKNSYRFNLQSFPEIAFLRQAGNWVCCYQNNILRGYLGFRQRLQVPFNFLPIDYQLS